jgi:hypothetical protein
MSTTALIAFTHIVAIVFGGCVGAAVVCTLVAARDTPLVADDRLYGCAREAARAHAAESAAPSVHHEGKPIRPTC